MNARFARLDAAFQAARRLPREQRAAAIERACAGDAAMREEVGALLAALDAAPEAEPALEVAGLVADAWPAETRVEDFRGFRILRRLASGGMGVVYEAEQAHPRRRVALKVLHPGAASDESRARFAREAEILARLHHPGIAQVHVFGVEPTPAGDRPFIAMELVEGEPLTVHARSLGVRGKLELLAKVCDAVAHAHANGAIHRDLKPSNILVTRNGEPKVLDFGVARLLDADTALRTRAGQVIGTLAYMSPEQATGDLDRVDTRSDVYALGVLGYEMLCGRLPHDVGESFPDAIRRIVEQEPSAPSSFDRALRGDVSLILLKALAKEPGRRYEGAAALAEDLRRHLRDEPILARPPTATYQIRKFVRRHRALVGGAAATMAALLAGLVLAVRAAREEERQRIRADRGAAEARWATSHALIEAAASDLVASTGQAARRRLERIPPEHRGWEWRYLAAQTDASMRSIPLDAGKPRALVFDGGSRLLGLIDDQRPALVDLRSGARTVPALPVRRWQHVLRLGDDLAVVGTEGRRLCWSRLGGGEMRSAELAPVISAAAGTRDGSRLAVSVHGGIGFSWIHVFDARSGERVTAVRGDPVEMHALAFSPDGRYLAAAGGWRFDIGVFDAATGAEVRLFRGHTGAPNALAFSPDGRFLASVADDKTVVVWDAQDGAARHRFVAHQGEVAAVAWSPDGARLASGDACGTLRVWDLATGTCERVLHGHEGRIDATAFRDGSTLASAGADGVREWDVTPGRDPDVLRHHAGRPEGNPYPYVYAVAFSPDGSLLASGGWDRTVRLADPATGDLLATLGHTDARIFDVAFSRDGRRLIAGSNRQRTWDPDTGRPLAEGTSDVQERGFAPSPDGRTFAAAGGAHLRLLDAETLEPRAVWSSGGRGVLDGCAWSMDGRLLVTVGTDGRCVVRALPAGEVVREIDAHRGGAFAVAFDGAGERLATGGADRTVRVWDVRSGRRLSELRGHLAQVYALAFHPEGTLLASGADDNTVRVWDLERGVERIELRGHGDYVHGLAFSPDGETLASASGDGTVRLWTTLPMRERLRRAEAERAARAAVAPRVEALFARHADARAVVDAVRGDEALDDAERRAALHLVLKRGTGTR